MSCMKKKKKKNSAQNSVFATIFQYYFLKHPNLGKKSTKTTTKLDCNQKKQSKKKKLTSIGLYDLDGKKVKIYNETKALFLFRMFLIHIVDFSFFCYFNWKCVFSFAGTNSQWSLVLVWVNICRQQKDWCLSDCKLCCLAIIMLTIGSIWVYCVFVRLKLLLIVWVSGNKAYATKM